MRTSKPQSRPRRAEPAANQAVQRKSTTAASGGAQASAFPSRSGQSLLTSLNGSSTSAAQRAIINSMGQNNLAARQSRLSASLQSPVPAQLREESSESSGQDLIQRKTDSIDKDTIFDEEDAEEEKEPGDLVGKAETGMEIYSTVDDTIGEITGKDSDLSSDNLEWKDDGTKRSPEEQKQWLKDNGYSESDVEKMQADASTKDAVTSSIGTTISFLKVPSMWKKFKTAENNYDKFEQVLEGLGTGAEGVSTGAKIADASRKGQDSKAQDTSAISEYTGGIIGLVKSGFQSCMKLKGAYEDYQLIKDNKKEDASKLEGAKIAFEESLANTQGILTNINTFQKTFGTAQDLALKAAIPAIGIALSTISLIGRIVTLVQQNKLDFGKTAQESQTDSILSKVEDSKKDSVREILLSEKFRVVIRTRAEYMQQQRDNKAIFGEYVASETDPKLKARLQKRYPKNYARIDEIYKRNKMSFADVNEETKKLMGLGVTDAMITAIIDDQSLINHLDEIKGKRSRNAKIGIFTDLVNIGADIAVLTGTGAAVGAGMKAGTAAIEMGRKGGNAIKFAARAKGAEDFSSGAEKGLFGKSMFDSTDILKNDKAKRERYFNSARLLVENIGDHEKQVAAATKPITREQHKKFETSYKWIEAKVLGAGASVTLLKAMANSDSKSGNEVVKYLMDKMKAR